MQVWLAWCGYRIGIRHLKTRQPIVAVLILLHSHGAILEIMLHLASQKPSPLSAVAQFKILTEQGQEEFYIELIVLSGYNGIIDMNC